MQPHVQERWGRPGQKQSQMKSAAKRRRVCCVLLLTCQDPEQSHFKARATPISYPASLLLLL